MASKVFVDANVLLDFTLKRAAYQEAKQIVELALQGHIALFITPSIVHIVGYWLSKAYGAAKAKEILLTLLADVQVIDMPHEIVVSALHSKMKDIEDALQYYTAIHHKLNYFISSDAALLKESIPVLPIFSPKQFLKFFIVS